MTPKLDPSIHPAPSTMAREAHPEYTLTNNCDVRIYHAAGASAERSRIIASPSAALDLLCHALAENPVLVATVRGLVTPHLPVVKP